MTLNTAASSDPKFVKTVLSEKIKERLIEDILNRKYKPGDRLIELAIAREFNVSQSTVREAFRSLVAMGFLESEPYKGNTVKSFTSEDLWEVFAVRAALESLAARLATERITEEELQNLESIMNAMIQAGEEGDIEKRLGLNNDFHEELIRASGNKIILKIFQDLSFATWSAMTGSYTRMDRVLIASRHRVLIDALRSRDPERAAKVMQEHIESVAKPICEIFDQGRAEGADQSV